MRDLFHVPDRYFLSHSVGCLPIGAEAALSEQFFGPWRSGKNWADWMPIFDEFRSGLAALFSVEPATICPQTNISSALTKILYSLPRREGRDVILLSKQDFPTIGFVFKQAERHGYHVKYVEGDPTLIDTWFTAIDETVAIVHITHATSNTSHLLPAGDICELARSKGAVSIVDIAQSAGVVPIPLTHWRADFAIGTGVKFLCFGPGACFLYVAPHILPDCEPIDTGWFSHENPFEMEIENFRHAPDALRFFGGTPSPAPFILANFLLELWERVGRDLPAVRIDECLFYLCDVVKTEFIVSPTQTGKRGGTFVVAPQDRAALNAALTAKGIRYDERKEGFRFSKKARKPSPKSCDEKPAAN